MESITVCEVLPDEQGPNTDHFPILTSLTLKANRTPPQIARNYREVDWKEFQEALAKRIALWGIPNLIKTQSELDMECQRLMEALQGTIEEKVPKIRLGPQCRRWWTKELAEMRKEMLKARRKAYKDKQQTDMQALNLYRENRRRFSREIKHTKCNHWRDWLEKASDPDIWTVQRYLNTSASDGGKTRIPDLKFIKDRQQSIANKNSEKGTMLANTFFPPKPDVVPEEENTNWPDPIDKMPAFTEDQIQRQLVHLKPYKAPGPDGIPNIVLTKCANIIAGRLGYIYVAILNRSMYYEPWKTSLMVVLRKPGKPRYDIPKAYRPIALLNTLEKLLTALVAESLTYYAEKFNLLPHTHFGGRPARATNDVLHYLVYKIKDTWRKKKVVSVLFLDIKGAFPNAVNERLLSNLRRRRIPVKILHFVENMLKNGIMWLKFDDHVSGNIRIDNGRL